MTVSLWQDHSAERSPRSAEFVVIGGGIAGASVAYWLTERGRQVVVVEGRAVAAGATGRNAGFLLTGTADNYARAVARYGRDRARALWEFSRENLRLLRRHVAELGLDSDCGIEWQGSCLAAADAKEWHELEHSAQLLREDAFAVELLAAERLNTTLGGQGFFGGLVHREDGAVDPVRLTEGLFRRAAQGGGELLLGEVHALEKEGGRLRVRTAAGDLMADHVFLCTNAWGPILWPELSRYVRPVRGQILALEPAPRSIPWPVYTNYGYEYFRQLSDGRLLLGGMRQPFSAEEVGYSDETTAPLQAELERFIARHLPRLVGRRVTHRWSGTMAFSTDDLPLVARAPDRPLTFVGGFTGHGLGFAFHLGKQVVAQELDGIALPLFDVRRLEQTHG